MKPDDVYARVLTLENRIYWLSAIVISLILAQMVWKFFITRYEWGVLEEISRYLEWTKRHGELNDQQKVRMQQTLADMQEKVAKDIPVKVKAAVHDAVQEAVEQGSGKIAIPPGSLPPIIRKGSP